MEQAIAANLQPLVSTRPLRPRPSSCRIVWSGSLIDAAALTVERRIEAFIVTNWFISAVARRLAVDAEKLVQKTRQKPEFLISL